MKARDMNFTVPVAGGVALKRTGPLKPHPQDTLCSFGDLLMEGGGGRVEKTDTIIIRSPYATRGDQQNDGQNGPLSAI